MHAIRKAAAVLAVSGALVAGGAIAANAATSSTTTTPKSTVPDVPATGIAPPGASGASGTAPHNCPNMGSSGTGSGYGTGSAAGY